MYKLSTTNVKVIDQGTEILVSQGFRFFRLTHKEAGELAGALNEAVARKEREGEELRALSIVPS